MSRASEGFRVLAAVLCVSALPLVAGRPARAAGVLVRRIAVFRPSTQEWVVRRADGSRSVTRFGNPEDQPVPADYFGTGETQIAVFRPSTAEWRLRLPDGSAKTPQFGVPGDVPVPADYLGLGHAQIAVFHPATGDWDIRRDDGTMVTISLGAAGDLPVPADYAGAGHAQIAVFRPSTHEWWVRNADGSTTITSFGEPGDLPVPADYLGLGHAQLALFRPAGPTWLIRDDRGQMMQIAYGMAGDLPVPGDYAGLGHAQIAVFHPETREWSLRVDDRTKTVVPFGDPGDVPIPWLEQDSTFTIYGATYVTSDPRETLTATFTRPDGGVTLGSYEGPVLIHVTGVGQAYANVSNDAFYLYSNQFSGSPQNGHDGGYYQLAFGTSPLRAFDVATDAENFLVDSLPPYNPAHDYTFILDTTLDSPGHLQFGVSDGGYSDNKGAYTITVTELVPRP